MLIGSSKKALKPKSEPTKLFITHKYVVVNKVVEFDPTSPDALHWFARFESWCEAQVEKTAKDEQGNEIPVDEQWRAKEVECIKIIEIESVVDETVGAWMRYYKLSNKDPNTGTGPSWESLKNALIEQIPLFKLDRRRYEMLKWNDDLNVLSWYYTNLRFFLESTDYNWPEVQLKILKALPFGRYIKSAINEEKFAKNLLFCWKLYLTARRLTTEE